MDKLKPCPCCGSERVDTLKGNWMESDKPFWKVWCKSCQVRTWCEPTRKGAIAVWNTRATDTELAAAKARIAELEAERFTRQELDIIRQWYNAVQDVSPRYLNADDIDDDSVFLKVCTLLKEKE